MTQILIAGALIFLFGAGALAASLHAGMIRRERGSGGMIVLWLAYVFLTTFCTLSVIYLIGYESENFAKVFQRLDRMLLFGGASAGFAVALPLAAGCASAVKAGVLALMPGGERNEKA